MPRIEDRLILLERVPPPVAAAILLEALRHAEVRERQSLARMLLATGCEQAVAAVIGMLRELPRETADELIALGARLAPGLRAVCREGRTAGVLNALDVIDRAGHPAVMELAVDLLVVANEPVAVRSGEVIGNVVRRHLELCGAWSDPSFAEPIEQALVKAAETITIHGDPEVLLAIALAAPAAGPALRGLLAQDDHPAVLAMRRIPANVEHPAVATSLIRWLGDPALGRAAGRWLHLVSERKLWGTVGASWHLLLAPARRHALRAVAEPRRCLPGPIERRVLGPAVEAGLPRLIEGLRLPGREVESALMGLSAARSVAARAHAVVGLARRTRTGQAISPFLDDPSSAMCHLAATCGARVSRDRAFGAEALTLRRTPRLVRRGRRFIARRSVDDLLRTWDHLGPGDRLAATRIHLENDRTGLIRALRTLLASPDRQTRSCAVALVRRVGLTTELASEVSRLAHDPAPKVVAAAITALGDLPPAAPHAVVRRRAIAHALRHADPRVRANGIEAGTPGTNPETSDGDVAWDRVLGLVGRHDENRPRANAIRAMLHRDPAQGQVLLGSMLVDPKPLHRVSALWVARIARVVEARPTVERLAIADPLPLVRRRARSVLRTIDAAATSNETETSR